MGKSTLLQAISGLDDHTIPTSAGEPCTGAKSKILHHQGEPHAVVEYFTEAEFLVGIVHSYFSDLGLSPLPASLAAFAHCLPPKPADLPPVLHAIYHKLEKLHQLLPRFLDLLSRPPERISMESIRPYVSQDDGRYMAVKCAAIYAPFPHGDVTGLGLIDLPGLGEIAKGHGDKLMRSLEQDVDAVIVVKRPLPGRAVYDTEDYRVFDLVKQTVPELELADWLFVVLNRDSNNAQQVEILRTNPPQIGTIPRLIEADCRSQQEVGDNIFMEVLRHLEKNLERIDQVQIAALASHLSNLANEAVSVARLVSDYFQKDTAGTGDFLKFGELFRVFCTQIRTNLDCLTDDYRRLVRTKGMAGEFRDVVEEACNAAKASVPIPSPDYVKGRFANLGGWPGVIQEELHYLRSYLTQSLADILDRRLGEMVEEARRKIMVRLMADPLGHVLPQEGRKEADSRQQLELFCQMLDKGAQPTLLAGVNYMLSFSFSYQSHFHHRVREAMDPLDPLSPEGLNTVNEIVCGADQDVCPEEAVGRGLRLFYDRVVWIVRKRLHQEMENDPMRAIFSMVEETRDRLVRAKDIERQWQWMLYPRRAEVWPEEFNRFAVASAQRQEWQDCIEAVNRSASKLRSPLT
jgi:hypothetical protein